MCKQVGDVKMGVVKGAGVENAKLARRGAAAPGAIQALGWFCAGSLWAPSFTILLTP